MKTTIELPDDLFSEAKQTAARRRTTLRSIIEHALRREIYGTKPPSAEAPYVLDEYGYPLLKRDPEEPQSTEDQIQKLQEQMDMEDAERAYHPNRKSS